MCPENPMGYLNLGWVYWFDILLSNTRSPRETLEKINELAQKVLAMDDSLGGAHGLLSMVYLAKREYDKAIAEGERAVALSPGHWGSFSNYANCLSSAGRPEEAIPSFQKAIRLNPSGYFNLYINFGRTLRMTGRFEEAVSAYKKASQLAPDSADAHIGLLVIYSMMGREKEARAEAEEVLRINPKFAVDRWEKGVRAMIKDQSEIDKAVDALRKAGLE